MKSILLVFLCAGVVAAQPSEEWRIVNTTQGPVRGYKEPDGGLFAFYNIPYATTPTGENKFKNENIALVPLLRRGACSWVVPTRCRTDACDVYMSKADINPKTILNAPLPPPVWLQTYEAVNKVVMCPQISYELGITQNIIMQENCLSTSIYVPDTEDKNLSVVVYIHGGGFQIGFGDLLTPKNLVKTGKVIAVTFNYRLGVHGFLCLGTEKAPGNAGLKDQVALLRWVKRNIASFAGNPDDVTLAGYSAGSMSVDLLMLSKSAEGLFNKVIPESGANIGSIVLQMHPLDLAKDYALQHNFTNVNNLTALEKFFTTASLELLIIDEYITKVGDGFFPCVERNVGEETIIEEPPLNILRRGDYVKKPMLYGFTNMEGIMQLPHFETFKVRMNEKFSDFLPIDLQFETEEEKEEISRSVKQFYFGDGPVSEENILNYVDYFTDILFAYSVLRAVKYHLEAGHNQIYLYEYSFINDNTPIIPYTNVTGADHTAQTEAVLDGPEATSDEYRKMKEIMRELWSNFIITGQPVPQGSRLPAWPAVTNNRTPHMSLGQNIQLKGLLLEERYLFWENIYERYLKLPSPFQ